jgi:hypothetical protein
MENFPRPNTIGDLARKFRRKDVHHLAEDVHFGGPEKEGTTYRFVAVRRGKEQMALFTEFESSYRICFTNTDWSKHRVVHFYRGRGDAENVIKEQKEGYGVENILSEDLCPTQRFSRCSSWPTTWFSILSTPILKEAGGHCGSNS